MLFAEVSLENHAMKDKAVFEAIQAVLAKSPQVRFLEVLLSAQI